MGTKDSQSSSETYTSHCCVLKTDTVAIDHCSMLAQYQNNLFLPQICWDTQMVEAASLENIKQSFHLTLFISAPS